MKSMWDPWTATCLTRGALPIFDDEETKPHRKSKRGAAASEDGIAMETTDFVVLKGY